MQNQLKKELNRIIGREIENNLEKEVGFEKQDIVINVDLKKILKLGFKLIHYSQKVNTTN